MLGEVLFLACVSILCFYFMFIVGPLKITDYSDSNRIFIIHLLLKLFILIYFPAFTPEAVDAS